MHENVIAEIKDEHTLAQRYKVNANLLIAVDVSPQVLVAFC